MLGGGCQDTGLAQRRFVRRIGGCAYIFGLFGAVVAGVSLRHARWEWALCLDCEGGGSRLSSLERVEVDW